MQSGLRTALVFKLMAYLSRTGKVRSAEIRGSIQEVAMAAAMLADHPHLISEPVNFRGAGRALPAVARHAQAAAPHDGAGQTQQTS